MTRPAILERLRGVQSAGSGWSAFCPAHDDQAHRSLSIGLGADSRTLLKCHARGCSVEEIAHAVRMSLAELAGNGHTEPRREVCHYDYHDEDGVLLYQVVRFEPKDFRPRRPDGAGGWLWNLQNVRRVVYCLDELPEQTRVFLVEGEKDADRLRALGLAATTTPGGAASWRDEYAQQIRDAAVVEVVAVPDHDPAGLGYVMRAAAGLTVLGVMVRVLELPGLREKEDVSDWLDAGHGTDELRALADQAPVFGAAHQADRAGFEPCPIEPNGSGGPVPPEAADDLALTPLGALLEERDDAPAWLVENRLPAGGLGLLAGKPKAGKSTMARCLALRVARGEPFLGFPTLRGPVIYLALEEKRSEVRAHFRALGATGADPIYVLCAAAPLDALARLRREVERRRPVLIIIDPLFRLLRVPAERGNDYAFMTAALEPLLTLAHETGAHVLVVHHLGKGERADGDAILGSTAIFAAVDTALLLKRSERYRTLASVQRYGEDLEEITLTLDPDTRDVTAGPPRADAETADAGRLLLAFFAAADAPVSEADLDGAIECRRQTWKRALRELVAGNQILRTGHGGKVEPFRYSGSHPIPGNQGTRTLFPALTDESKGKDSGSQVPPSIVVPKVPGNREA